MGSVRACSIERRELWDISPKALIHILKGELRALVTTADNLGLRPAARLNATADIFWERKAPELFAEFSRVTFYDYTKAPDRVRPRAELPANYHLTSSWSPSWTAADVHAECKAGRSVAIPFAPLAAEDRGTLPSKFGRRRIVDGDAHDLMFLHRRGSVIGLQFKGAGGARPVFAPGAFAHPF